MPASVLRTTILTLIFLLVAGPVLAVQEICGDGIDNDSSGGDASCTGKDDTDRDGYGAALDCDNNDRFVFDGVYRGCNAGGGANTGYQKCNGSTWGSCISNSTPLCEATGAGGACYYVNCDTGNDSNAGTFASPWLTPQRVTYWESGAPGNYVGHVGAGDVIYLMGSGCTETYDPGASYSPTYITLRNAAGTAADRILIANYPGHTPIIDANAVASTFPIYVQNSDYVVIRGLQVQEGWDAGITYISGSDNGEILLNRIHNNAGDAGNNVDGISLEQACNDTYIHNNYLYDNYDTDTDNENNANIHLFQGTRARVSYNVLTETAAGATNARGIRYKHGGIATDTCEIDHNIVIGGGVGIEWGQAGCNVHDNIIADMTNIGLRIADLGGTFLPDNELVEHNTVLNSQCFGYYPSSADISLGDVTYRNNLCIDDLGVAYSCGGETSLIRVDTFGLDTVFTANAGLMSFTGNCYYNNQSQSPLYDYFCSTSGGQNQGNTYSFANWKGTAGYDTSGSYEENPSISTNLIEAASTNCTGKGWVLTGASSATTNSVVGGTGIFIDRRHRRND